MAGAGYKLFNTGDVLTAQQVNEYLMQQTVMVFADASARTTALSGVLAEGMISYLKDTNAVERYDGSTWSAIGAGDIEGVTAGTGLSGGGTSGTVTLTNDMATTITASGDIIVGTGNATYDNLPIGTTGQVLTADTTVSPYKVKWAAAGGDKTITEKATGSFSGSTTSISGLTDDNIMILAWNVRPSTTQQVAIRFNNNSSSLYYYVRLAQRNASSSNFTSIAAPEAAIWPGFNWLNTGGDQGTVINLTNCKQSGYTFFDILTFVEDGSGNCGILHQGYFRSAAQLTSVSFEITGANFTRGSWAVLGG